MHRLRIQGKKWGKASALLKYSLYRDRPRKKEKGGGRQRGSSVASHTDAHGSPSFAPQLPHLGKWLVNWPGETDLATMPHPLLPRTAFPLPHPTLQLQRFSPSKEMRLNASLFTRSASVVTEANEVWLVNLEKKIERQTEATLSSALAQTLPEKGELVQLLWLYQ